MHWSFFMHRDDSGAIQWRWRADERARSYTSYESYPSLAAALKAATDHGLLDKQPNVMRRPPGPVRRSVTTAGRVKRTLRGHQRCAR